MIAAPPVVLGASQATSICPLPAVRTTFCGVSGVVIGVAVTTLEYELVEVDVTVTIWKS